MPCCGKKREQFRAEFSGLKPPRETEVISVQRQVVAYASAYFQYTGKTGLTALGPVSRQRYRFDSPGAIITVDARDAPYLVAVPNLRRVKTPAGTILAPYM